MGANTEPGVRAAANKRAVDRERQNETLGPIDFSRGRLEHARFIAAQTGFKQTRSGDIEITLQVPFEYRDLAMGMLDASGLPLSVDVVPWKRGVTHDGR